MRVVVLMALIASAHAFQMPVVQKTSRVGGVLRSPLCAIAVPLEGGVEKESNADYVGNEKDMLDPEDAWIASLDYEGFGREVMQLGKELVKEGGTDDVEHLNEIVSWRNGAAILGIATLWMAPNPITIAALSTWTYASWTMIAHHTCHGGYNRVDAGKFNSRGFALGNWKNFRRLEDWLDWMLPEAWNIEHNRLHHYRLNEAQDPDLVQRNLELVRDSKEPLPLKYAAVLLLMTTWKWFYYAPNTYKELKLAEWTSSGKEIPKNAKPTNSVTILSMLTPSSDSERALVDVLQPAEFFKTVMAPFFLMRYVVLPTPFLLFGLATGEGTTFFEHAIISLILAEILTNVHSFFTIVTNHAGEDLYTFDDAVKPNSPSFCVRQVAGSVNYSAGTNLIDFAHGYLNYQIEHHVWPSLSMLQYQKGAPKLKKICEKYGVPYIQENVFERTRKTIDVMLGISTMRKFPTEYEPAKDKAQNVQWKRADGAIDEENE